MVAEQKSRWEIWVDRVIPVGALLVIAFSIGSVFYGPNISRSVGPPQAHADGSFKSLPSKNRSSAVPEGHLSKDTGA